MSQATQGAPAPATPPSPAAAPRRRPRPRRSRTRAAYAGLGTVRRTTAARRQAAQVPADPAPAAARRGRRRAWCSGPLAGAPLTLSWQAAPQRPAADTDQLIRVQAIQTNLLRADADATNAFLVGGLEPAEQRAAYDDAIDQSVAADRRGRRRPSRPTARRSAP